MTTEPDNKDIDEETQKEIDAAYQKATDENNQQLWRLLILIMAFTSVVLIVVAYIGL